MVAFDIESETALVKAILAHPAGYDLDWGGVLCIRPTGGPFNNEETWEVEWEAKPPGSQKTDKQPLEVSSFPKENLDEAAAFYVQKRHELGWGLDFEQANWEQHKGTAR